MKASHLAVALLLAAGPAASISAAAGTIDYYREFGCITDGLFDKSGAALVDYGPELGRRHNPVTISQYAIGCAERFQATKDQRYLKTLKGQIRYLKTHAIPDGPDMAYYTYDFPWSGYGLAAGWRSGLAQGQAISALIRYYRITGDRTVVTLIQNLKNYMLLPESKGGVAVKSPEGRLWIEEYPSDPPSYVLNGYISAVFALYEYAKLFPDDATTRRQLKDALASIKLSLPAYDTGEWALLDRRRPPYPRANDNYMQGYIRQLQALEEIAGAPFFGYMSLRWRSFFSDVGVHRLGNTVLRRGVYRVRASYPVLLPHNLLPDNAAAIRTSPAYPGFGAGKLLDPIGAPDYRTYFAALEDGPAFVDIELKQPISVNTVVLDLYNVELFPLDLNISLKDGKDQWEPVAYKRGADRRHLAYYFTSAKTREIRLTAERFHLQDRLVLGGIDLGDQPTPAPEASDYGSFLSAPLTIDGHQFSVRVDAPPAADHNIIVMYRHAGDLAALRHGKWAFDFIDPLQPNERLVQDRLYQFRILYRGPALASGWKDPVVLDDGKSVSLVQAVE